MLKVGIIGPTNILNFAKLIGSKDFILERAQVIGNILAEADCELWANSDQGMLAAIGRAYKKSGGKKLVILYPEKGEPWPKQHAVHYVRHADELRKEPNWFWANYNVVTLPDYSICVGLSAGTFSELAYIKWNYQFKCGNLKKLIVVRELIRNGRLTPEIEIEIKEIIWYIEKAESIKFLFDHLIKRRWKL